MKINEYGQVTVTEQELLDTIYAGNVTDLKNIFVEDISGVNQFNNARQANADQISELAILKDLDISLGEFDKINQSKWFIPKEYQDINVIEYILDLTKNEEQYQRVVAELDLFLQYDMLNVLKFCIYLVDTLRQNKIFWGVGRGSSVASYVLYLIGIHKIDSLKYNLNIHEFLK